MPQPEALRLANELDGERYADVAAELRRLHAENEALREANEAFAQRQEWWNERMVALEAQRDALMEADVNRRSVTLHRLWTERDKLREQNAALLEALKEIGKYTGEGSMYTTPWQDIVCSLGEKARAAIAKAEGVKA